MKIKQLLEKLYEKESYKEFIAEYTDAFLCAGFFILEIGKTQYQLDFFIPKLKKLASFEYPFDKVKIYDDEVTGKLNVLNENIKVDLTDLEDKIEEVKKDNDAVHKTSKIIAILKNEGWNLTCLDNFMGMIRIKISSSGEVESFEKGSLMDFMGIKKLDK